MYSLILVYRIHSELTRRADASPAHSLRESSTPNADSPPLLRSMMIMRHSASRQRVDVYFTAGESQYLSDLPFAVELRERKRSILIQSSKSGGICRRVFCRRDVIRMPNPAISRLSEFLYAYSILPCRQLTEKAPFESYTSKHAISLSTLGTFHNLRKDHLCKRLSVSIATFFTSACKHEWMHL